MSSPLAHRPFKDKDVKGIVERNIHASKGDAGRVLIIGGTERYVGSAVLAGLAALRSGVDSVVIAAPEASARLMNAFSADLVTIKLPGEDLHEGHLGELERLSEKASVVLIGPGLGVSKQREEFLAQLVPRIKAPLVFDADATKQVRLTLLENAILYANKREYEYLKEFNHFTDEHLGANSGTNVIVIKGREDRVVTATEECFITGGHERATVAGTGDVLSGVAAAFYAQTKKPLQSAKAASRVAKVAAEKLASQYGFGFLASDMIKVLPTVIKELRVFRQTKYKK